MTDIKRCQHGVSVWGDPPPRCIRCEIIWYRDCLNDAARRVASLTELISKLERELEGMR